MHLARHSRDALGVDGASMQRAHHFVCNLLELLREDRACLLREETAPELVRRCDLQQLGLEVRPSVELVRHAPFDHVGWDDEASCDRVMLPPHVAG